MQPDKGNKKEWRNRLKAAYEQHLRSGKRVLPEHKSQQLLDQLHQRILLAATNTTNTRVVNMQRLRVAVSVAAILLLVAGGFWWFNTSQSDAQLAQLSHPGKQQEEVIQTNKSDTIQQLILSDSSIVHLSPGAAIRYYSSFDTGRRDISLSGKAEFKVTSHKLRPFTVYAGNISTTVLGTRFMMSTLEQDKVWVKLFEGKVVLRSSVAAMSMHDVYLQPGEQCIIDNVRREYAVTQFKGNTASEQNNSKTKIAATPLEFKQEPLKRVLQKIGDRYRVQFEYTEAALSNILVTGQFLPADSLDVVLNLLGSSNGLFFTKNGRKITVTSTH